MIFFIRVAAQYHYIYSVFCIKYISIQSIVGFLEQPKEPASGSRVFNGTRLIPDGEEILYRVYRYPGNAIFLTLGMILFVVLAISAG